LSLKANLNEEDTMQSKTTFFKAIAGSTIAFSALFTGCLNGPSEKISDEFARISSQEVANMGDNSSTMIGSPLSKNAVVAGDTTYYDWKIHPYTWDASIGGYIRTATFSCSDGYDRVRIDTLVFKDAGGNGLQYPTLATVKNISHVRNVTRTKAAGQLNIRVSMNSVISLSPDTTHVKNGTITGTFDGDQIATGTITDVTRQRTNGYWQFPRSGSVKTDFPRRTYEVEFMGGGDAKLTITNKVTDKTTVLTYHVDER
jgi:hypothetical protein